MSADPVESVRAVFEQRYGQLVALARTIVGDRAAAEDVVQDAFAEVIRRKASLRGDVAGYVVQSVVNGARSVLRRREVERRPRPVERRPDRIEPGGDLFRLVEQLPARQAQVIVCRFVLDLTFEQTATVLGISRRAARTHADRGMDQLKEWTEE